MARSLMIAGVERWADYERGSLQIQKGLTYTSDSCKFELRGVKPDTGDAVSISEDGILIYSGVVVKIDSIPLFEQGVMWSIDCDDYSAVLSRMLVVEVYEGYTAGAILQDIIDKYVDAGFTVSIASGSPLIAKMVFNYVHVSEAFKQVCDYIGWQWTVTPGKVITFFNPAILITPAPMEIVQHYGVGGLFTNFKFSIDTSSLRNRTYVIGGKLASDVQTYEWKSDGAARIWPLPFEPYAVSGLQVGGVAYTYGEENTETGASADYLYSTKDKRLKCNTGTSTPTAGVTIHLEYTELIDIVTYKEDEASQAAIAAIQGNDGVYEYKLVDNSLVTLEAAEAAAEADMRENANPKTTGSFDTDVTGWEPGQLVTITLPLRGITGEYMVQSTSMKPRPLTGWITTVNFGGRLLGVADWLAALVNDQKSADSSSETIMKYVVGTDGLGISDELITTSHAGDWVCETSYRGRVTAT